MHLPLSSASPRAWSVSMPAARLVARLRPSVEPSCPYRGMRCFRRWGQNLARLASTASARGTGRWSLAAQVSLLGFNPDEILACALYWLPFLLGALIECSIVIVIGGWIRLILRCCAGLFFFQRALDCCRGGTSQVIMGQL